MYCNLNSNNGLSNPTAHVIHGEDHLLRKAIEHSFVGFDACSLMLAPAPRREAFYSNLLRYLHETGRKVWITVEVFDELMRLSRLYGNPRAEETAEKARKALQLVDRLQNEGHLQSIIRTTCNGHGDLSLGNVVSNLRGMHDEPLAVVTQESNLARVLLAQNLSNDTAQPVLVYRVKKSGSLGEFDFTQPPPERSVRERSFEPAAPGSPVRQTPAPRQTAPQRRVTPLGVEGNGLTNSFGPGSLVYGCTSGKRYSLGDHVGGGAEADVFSLGQGLCAKIFTSAPSARKEAKCRMLLNNSTRLAGLAAPVELLKTPRGVFCGYVMEKLDGVPLTELFSDAGREENGVDWTRAHFAALAHTVGKTMADLAQEGVLYTDPNPANMMVCYDDDGILNPRQVAFMDADSCQLDTEKFGENLGTIPGDGITPEYASPQMLIRPFSTESIISEQDYVFMMMLLTGQIVLCGTHPFQACRKDEDRSIVGAIRYGLFPYSNGALDKPREMDIYRFSYLPRGLKELMWGMFDVNGESFQPVGRPELEAVADQLKYYAQWVCQPHTLRIYPQVQWIKPEVFRPTLSRCANENCPNHWVDMPRQKVGEAEHEGLAIRVGDQYYCYSCAAQQRAPQTAQAQPCHNGWTGWLNRFIGN